MSHNSNLVVSGIRYTSDRSAVDGGAGRLDPCRDVASCIYTIQVSCVVSTSDPFARSAILIPEFDRVNDRCSLSTVSIPGVAVHARGARAHAT